MSQINVHVTPEFEEALRKYMRIKGFRTKSAAVRAAVEDGLARAVAEGGPCDFSTWLGAACGGENPAPRFESEDELWS